MYIHVCTMYVHICMYTFMYVYIYVLVLSQHSAEKVKWSSQQPSGAFEPASKNKTLSHAKYTQTSCTHSELVWTSIGDYTFTMHCCTLHGPLMHLKYRSLVNNAPYVVSLPKHCPNIFRCQTSDGYQSVRQIGLQISKKCIIIASQIYSSVRESSPRPYIYSAFPGRLGERVNLLRLKTGEL